MARILRKLSVLSVLLLALALAVPALAQGGDPLCNGLSDADCQLLLSVNSAMTGVSSFSTPAWAIDLTLTDGTQEFKFNASGSGAFQFSPGGSQLLVHLMIDQASLVSPEVSQAGSAEIIVTQDMAYIFYNGEWYGTEVTEEDLSGLGDFSSLGGMMGSAGGIGGAAAAAGIDLTGVLTTARGADEQVGGQPTATFTTDVNVGQLLIALLSSPMIGQALGMAGDELGMEQMTPEDIQMMGMFLTPLLGQTKLSVSQWVGLNDNLLHKLALNMIIDLQLGMFDPEVPPITGNISFTTEIGAFNEPVSVSVPTSYRPIEELEAQFEELSALMG